MNRVKKILLWTVVPLLIAYVFICTFLYFSQERIIFRPINLEENHAFQFKQNFVEVNILSDEIELNALHFKADSSIGVVVFYHGNGGNIDGWAPIQQYYTSLGFDVVLLDYRGYGKSKGKYKNQTQFLKDAEAAYNYAKQFYQEPQIVVVGYSLGTSVASYVASKNQPKQLILMAPFYSFEDLMRKSYPFIPSFILKYKIKTFEFIATTTSPITIFQGEDDEDAFLSSSLKLKKHLKPIDEYVMLSNQGHNGIHSNVKFQEKLKEILQPSAVIE